MTITRGKIARNPTIVSVRALVRDDLLLLKEKRNGGDAASMMQRLRDPHHRLARLIASGLRVSDAATRAGYSLSRATVLMASPTFQELIAKYRLKVDERWLAETDHYYEQATANMMTAERMIAEKLEEHEENGTLPPVRELMAISRDAADRFGYGKRQTNLNVNADFASMLEAARKRSAGANAQVINPTPTQIEARLSSPVVSPQSPAKSDVPAFASSSGSRPLITRRA